MSHKLEWAKDYVKRVALMTGSSGDAGISGLELELYNLAKAIIADVYGDMP